MAVLLGLVAVAVALTVVVNSGGRPHQPTASRSAASHRAASTTARKRPGSRPGSPAVTHAASTATSTPTVAAPSAGSAGASASGRPASTATAPVSAVQSFYEFAASHRYAEAWALADPSLRAELLGYDRFVGDQSGDRSITFDAARTVSQSAGGATVAIQTTSVRVDGTHHCTGTVDLVPAGSARWVLHRVNIACT
jgi:hypothetical protein